MGTMNFGAAYDYLVYDMIVDVIPGPVDVERWIFGALKDVAKIEALKIASYDFESPVKGEHAYTLTAVLSASHMAVHTAPEHSWVQVAFALCDGTDRKEVLTRVVSAFFQPKSMKVSQFHCGIEGMMS